MLKKGSSIGKKLFFRYTFLNLIINKFLMSEESGIGLVELGELEAETSFISSQESRVK